MTIYRLGYDRFEWPIVNISPDEIEDKFSNGRSNLVVSESMIDAWNTLNGTYYYSKDNPVKNSCPDLSKRLWEMVFSEEAKTKLEKSLGKYAEFLPISIDGDKRYIFNLLNATSAIDQFNSKMKIHNGVEMGVEKIAFLAHEVKDLCIFNTPYDGYSHIYCTDEFKSLIENSGLTSGWSFHEKLRDLE